MTIGGVGEGRSQISGGGEESGRTGVAARVREYCGESRGLGMSWEMGMIGRVGGVGQIGRGEISGLLHTRSHL